MAVPALQELRVRREEILGLAAARGAHRVRVFGSVARGDSTPPAMSTSWSNWTTSAGCLTLGGCSWISRRLLGCDVDVTTEAGLRPRGVADRVLADAVEL